MYAEARRDIKAIKCSICFNDEAHNKFEEERELKYSINRNILKELIRTTSFIEIGKIYGVSDTNIRKWCKRYNLPYKSKEIKGYTDEEWESI